MILVLGCKSARQVKTYLKKKRNPTLVSELIYSALFNFKRKMKEVTGLDRPELVFSRSTMLSFPHASVLLGLEEAEHITHI